MKRLLLLCLVLTACTSANPLQPDYHATVNALATEVAPTRSGTLPPPTGLTLPAPTYVPTLPPVVPTDAPPLEPNQYRTQNGDTLPNIAARFRMDVATLKTLNPLAPSTGLLGGGWVLAISRANVPTEVLSTYLVPDNAVVYAPDAYAFDVQAYVESQPGFLATYSEVLTPGQPPTSGWQIVQLYGQKYSIHPKLLLALLEHQSQALTNPTPDEFLYNYPLNVYSNQLAPGLSHQLGWAGNQLNYGYYGWRIGRPLTATLADRSQIPFAPELNSGSVAVTWVLGQLYKRATFRPEEFALTYRRLFGEPQAVELLPVNLTQPPMQLPFEPQVLWAFTGGPHSAYGTTFPLGALDFAPIDKDKGCVPSVEWVTAVADGVVAFIDVGRVEQDLGNGWRVMYYHLATDERITLGTVVKTGDRLGHPSCEGGRSTGTHLHIARIYNGEWIPASDVAPFDLSGWVAQPTNTAYVGKLVKEGATVTACSCGDVGTNIRLTP